MSEKRALTKYELDEREAARIAKMEMDMSIYSPMFAKMVEDIDRRIKNSARQVLDEDFEEATIAVTIKISCEDKEAESEIISGADNQVRMTGYKAPHVKYRVTAKLVQKDTADDDTTYETHELIEKDGKLVAVPIKQAQLTISDFQDAESQQTLEELE